MSCTSSKDYGKSLATKISPLPNLYSHPHLYICFKVNLSYFQGQPIKNSFLSHQSNQHHKFIAIVIFHPGFYGFFTSGTLFVPSFPFILAFHYYNTTINLQDGSIIYKCQFSDFDRSLISGTLTWISIFSLRLRRILNEDTTLLTR